MSTELTIFDFLRSQSLRLMGVKIRGTLGVPFKGVSLIILPTWYYLSDPEQSACSRPAPCRCTPGKSGAARFVPLHGGSRNSGGLVAFAAQEIAGPIHGWFR